MSSFTTTTSKSKQSALRLRISRQFPLLLVFAVLLLSCHQCCYCWAFLADNLDQSPPNATNTVTIASLMGVSGPEDWIPEILDFTVQLINNHSDGWYDDLLPNVFLEYILEDSDCDPDEAVRAYLNVTRTRGADRNLHGIVGCECSGASIAVSRLCRAEDIPIISPTATSEKLSNKDEYSTFSRLRAPDNARGEVGGLMALMRSFGWNRISIINTDTQFSNDLALELSSAWKTKTSTHPQGGEVAYSATIQFLGGTSASSDQVDPFSVEQVLSGIPERNSRVVVLLAHSRHAYPILQIAQTLNILPPDTIWMGASSWIGISPQDEDANNNSSWMPEFPGYMGVVPYRNPQSPQFRDYLSRLQLYQQQRGRPVTEDLYVFETDQYVDSILALVMALSAVSPEQRLDGTLVVNTLRQLQFDGLSGPVSFTPEGDLANPRFAVMTKPTRGNDWVEIGYVTVGGEEGDGIVDIDKRQVCYPTVGCTINTPSDRYALPKDKMDWWIWIILGLLGLVCFLFIQQRLKTRSVQVTLRKLTLELNNIDNSDDIRQQKKKMLYQKIAELLEHPPPEHWTDEQGLVKVPPTTQEYWDVLDKLRETMSDNVSCYISELSRVQNAGIWSYYVFRKHQLANKYGTDLNDNERLNEQTVWHGTSSLNPDVIFNDKHDGFMMQLSQQGHWGRGIYFSERSGYSDHYSFKPLTKNAESLGKDREMFLVKLLVGNVKLMDKHENAEATETCKSLLAPPMDESTNARYDTVLGIVDDEYDTKIYVVYENGRAYPEYLVRYYLGDRDPERTPFASLEEALCHKKGVYEGPKRNLNADHVSKGEESSDEGHVNLMGVRREAALEMPDPDEEATEDEDPCVVVWEFLGNDDVWISYHDSDQVIIEQAYQKDPTSKLALQVYPYLYQLDLERQVQTNLDHPSHKTRKIRRTVLR